MTQQEQDRLREVMDKIDRERDEMCRVGDDAEIDTPTRLNSI